MKKTFSILAFLAVFPLTAVFANSGTDTQYYAQLVTKTSSTPTGAGKVYAGTTATAGTYQDSESTSGTKSTTTSGSTDTFYAFAKANDGFRFSHWAETDGGASGQTNNPYAISIAMSGTESEPTTKKLFAVFEVFKPHTFDVTFLTPSGGSYTIGGATSAYGTKHCEESYSAALAATVSNGYYFNGWYVTTDGGATKDFLSRNATYTASFTDAATVGADFIPHEQDAITLGIGASAGFECAASDKTMWTATSSAPAIATVSEPPAIPTIGFDPVITGVAKGTATITVKSDYSIYTYTVTVVQSPIALTVGGTGVTKNLTVTKAKYWKVTVADSTLVTVTGKPVLGASGQTSSTSATFDLTFTPKEKAGSTTVKVQSGTKSKSTYTWTDFAEYTVIVSEPQPPPDSAVLSGELRISEICPDDELKDPNGVGSGFVELVNCSSDAVNLSDYSLARFNRGKEIKAKKFLALPARTLAAGERIIIWATEGYIEGGDLAVAEPLMTDAEIRAIGKIGGSGDFLVLPQKISPKKRPVVILRKGKTDIDVVTVPVDTPAGWSLVTLDPSGKDLNGATRRYLTETPTPGTANKFSEWVATGPNVGPCYGVEHDVTDNDPTPPAVPGQDYEVALDVNPPYGCTGAKDAIASVTLQYRMGVDATTVTSVAMTGAYADITNGWRWTAKIPAAALPGRGRLIQWRAKIVDGAGNTWTSPSFNNPDDGYEWYGTIVEPGTGDTEGPLSAKLQTFHMFAAAGVTDTAGTKNTTCLMNKDYDDISSSNPLGARVAIYDSATSRYYDNVRIDLRGNSSSYYKKKSHGLRFAKANPLVLAKAWKHPVSGEKIKDVRKTSFVAEYCDPSYIRQLSSFWLMNAVGIPAPFHDPVRVNLNGSFYQLGFHSPRFTDELIEDIYAFDKLGYGYKNVGAFHLGVTDDLGQPSSTSAGAGTKKKTPDDGDERDMTVLNAFIAELDEAGKVAVSQDGKNTTGLENTNLTKKVTEKFDLPAWLNYLAATRISQEADDVWGNLSAYYDHADLADGTVRGTGTWRPLCWDMNASFGQWYYVHGGESGRIGCVAASDWNKCHPFYGGVRVRAWKPDHTSYQGTHATQLPNYAVEALYQHEKYRRLYLRRLRTLMDEHLKEPGVSEADTPVAVMMQGVIAKILDDAKKDRAVWGHLGTGGNNESCDWVNCWGSVGTGGTGTCQPEFADDGYRDIWNNYIVPRRSHLYVTHCVTNKAKATGYAVQLNAGIPTAQSAVSALKAKFSARYDATLGAAVIENANAETVDLSGWRVYGPVQMTLPMGTVIDWKAGAVTGEVYVSAARRATIACMTNGTSSVKLFDQVVVGDGTAVKKAASLPVALATAAGEPVVAPALPDALFGETAAGSSRFDVAAPYDGAEKTIDAAAVGALTVPGVDKTKVTYAAAAEGPWTATPPAFTGTGEHTVWYKVSTGVYADYVRAVKVTITQAANAWIVPPAVTGKVADGTAAAVENGTAKFGTSVVTYGGDTQAPVKVGTYTAVFTVAGTADYAGLVTNIVFTITSPASGDKEYETVEEAVAAATSENPITFAEPPVVDDAAHTITTQGRTISVPDHYTITLDGKTVVFTLNPAVATPAVTSGTTAGGDPVPALDVGEGESGEVGVGTTTRKGLFYALEVGDSPGALAVPAGAKWTKGDGGVMQLKASKPDGSANRGFYRVTVSDVEK